MRFGSIYLLTNQLTGEQYVGQTVKSVKDRWLGHCRVAKKPVFKISHNIHTYGADAFTVQELFSVFDKEGLDWAEKVFIKALLPTLNATSGGSGMPGQVAPEACAKRSEAAKKRWADPLWRERTVQALRNAHSTPEAKERGANLKIHNGGKIRWQGHVKKIKPLCDPSEITRKSWEDPGVRQRRVEGLKAAANRPEALSRFADRMRNFRPSPEIIAKVARTKWKPVYCPELLVTFLSQKYAAEYLKVLKTTVNNAIKKKGKVANKYTLVGVA
jgi:group I intron endonuclease